MILKPILNKNSPHAYMRLDFDILGVVGKLVKHAVHCSKEKKFKIMYFSFHRVPK
jgi:uncharacterized membrane protein affecting hemolysin expression